MLCACLLFPALANASSLNYFSVAGNQLTGTLPAVWADPGHPLASILQTLHLDGNNLSGSLPSAWTGSTEITCWSIANNPQMCGAFIPGFYCTDYNNTKIGELFWVGCSCMGPSSAGSTRVSFWRCSRTSHRL